MCFEHRYTDYKKRHSLIQRLRELLIIKLLLFLVYEVECGSPLPPTFGFLGTVTSTDLGATITYRCNGGFSPKTEILSTCTENGTWIPTPERHICTEDRKLWLGLLEFVSLRSYR